LSRAGLNSFQISYIMGHSLPSRDRAYLPNLRQEIEALYPTAYENQLCIVNGSNGSTKKKIEALSTTTDSLVQMLAEKDSIIRGLQAQLAENTTVMHRLLDLPTIRAEMLKAKEKVEIS